MGGEFGREWMHVCERVRAKSFQSCPTLWNATGCSLPGSPVHGILQARILEWVAMPSCRGSYWPRNRTCVSYVYPHWHVGSLPLAPPGKCRHMYIRGWTPLLSTWICHNIVYQSATLQYKIKTLKNKTYSSPAVAEISKIQKEQIQWPVGKRPPSPAALPPPRVAASSSMS